MCLTPLETNGEKTAASCHVPFIAVILLSGVTNCSANHYKENDSMTGKNGENFISLFLMYRHVTLSIIYIQTEMHKHRPLTCQLVHLSTRLFLARLDSGFHGSRHSHGRTRQESSVGGVLEPWQRERIRHEPRCNGRLAPYF